MFAVAIDGPSGAGKSSVARAAAEKIGFIYVDTGAIYRTVALALTRMGVDLEDEAAIERALPEIRIHMKRQNGEQRMFWDDEDVSEAIRTAENTKAASVVAAVPAVRAFLLELQRRMAEEFPVIMDGRDIGTVVLPGAQVKIFLTASAEERASRRMKQMESAGMPADYRTILEEIRERDERDSNREIAPLKPASGAVMLDSSHSTKEQTVAKILAIIRQVQEKQL